MTRGLNLDYLYTYQKLSSVQIDRALFDPNSIGDLWQTHKDKFTPEQIEKFKIIVKY